MTALTVRPEGLSLNLGEIVKTNDGSFTLRHPLHGECYHSYDGAYLEARELYVVRSGFYDALRNKRSVSVLDVGLGLSYNAMATLEAWWSEKEPADITLNSLEIDPVLVQELMSGKASWQLGWSQEWLWFCQSLVELSSGSETFERIASSFRPMAVGELICDDKSSPRIWQALLRHPNGCSQGTWNITVADARRFTSMPSGINFIWQDPFSPEKNPEMWNRNWFQLISQHAEKEAVLMSYSVARVTRDELEASGFQVSKISTATKKRHWLKAVL